MHDLNRIKKKNEELEKENSEMKLLKNSSIYNFDNRVDYFKLKEENESLIE